MFLYFLGALRIYSYIIICTSQKVLTVRWKGTTLYLCIVSIFKQSCTSRILKNNLPIHTNSNNFLAIIVYCDICYLLCVLSLKRFCHLIIWVQHLNARTTYCINLARISCSNGENGAVSQFGGCNQFCSHFGRETFTHKIYNICYTFLD